MLQTATKTAAAPAFQHLPADHGPVPNPLPKLLSGEDLPIEDAEHLFERLVLGRLEPAEIAGMLIALRMKGETADEMIGAAQALWSWLLSWMGSGLLVLRPLKSRGARVIMCLVLTFYSAETGIIRFIGRPGFDVNLSQMHVMLTASSPRNDRQSGMPPLHRSRRVHARVDAGMHHCPSAQASRLS